MSERLNAALVKDMPRSFVFHFKNQSFLTGPYAELVQNFAYYHNMTLVLEVLEDITSAREIYGYLVKEIYNVTTFTNTYNQRHNGIQHSYPVDWMRKCVMVPIGDQIPKYLYIFWPYGRFIWTAVFLGSIYIAILMRFIETRTGNVPTHSIVRNIPHALNITLYTMNMQAHIKNPPNRMVFFYSLLYLYGFILSAYHQPYMTAYNMKPIFVPPLNTVQDILDAELKIIITRTDHYEMRRYDLSEIEHVMENVSNRRFEALLKNYTRKYAYVVAKDPWEFMDKQQKNLKKPYFHLTPICFGAAFRSFPFVANWKYAAAFNLFLLRVQQSGLWTQWVDIAFARAVASGHAKILSDTYPVEPLDLEFFIIAWVVLAMGLSCGLLVNLIEIGIWRYKGKNIYIA